MLGQQLIDLKSAHQENNGRVIEEKRPGRIVLAIKFNYIFVSAVFIVHLLSVVWLNKGVMNAMSEKSRNKALIEVLYWF